MCAESAFGTSDSEHGASATGSVFHSTTVPLLVFPLVIKCLLISWCALPCLATLTFVPTQSVAPQLPEPRLRPPERPGKVPLEKGYSQMDWIRLTRQHPNLAGMRTCPHVCSGQCSMPVHLQGAQRSASCTRFMQHLILWRTVQSTPWIAGGEARGQGLRTEVTYWQSPERPAGLGGAPLRRDITLKEVALHNSPEDAWLALRGKVHNSLDHKAPGELPVSDLQP